MSVRLEALARFTRSPEDLSLKEDGSDRVTDRRLLGNVVISRRPMFSNLAHPVA